MHQNGKAAQEGGRIAKRARLLTGREDRAKCGFERELPAACSCGKTAFLNHSCTLQSSGILILWGGHVCGGADSDSSFGEAEFLTQHDERVAALRQLRPSATQERKRRGSSDSAWFALHPVPTSGMPASEKLLRDRGHAVVLLLFPSVLPDLFCERGLSIAIYQ